MTATEPQPAPESLGPKDYEIACLKLRNEQMHALIVRLRRQLDNALLRARKEAPP